MFDRGNECRDINLKHIWSQQCFCGVYNKKENTYIFTRNYIFIDICYIIYNVCLPK